MQMISWQNKNLHIELNTVQKEAVLYLAKFYEFLAKKVLRGKASLENFS